LKNWRRDDLRASACEAFPATSIVSL